MTGDYHSSESSYDAIPKGDVCQVALTFRLAAGHSHPHFKWVRDRGVWCGKTMMTGSYMVEWQNDRKQENK